jgi:hypothetical protein
LTFPSILEKTFHLAILIIPSFPQTSSNQEKLVNQQSRFALPYACWVIPNVQIFKNPIIKMLIVNQTNHSWILYLKASIIHFAIATCATTKVQNLKAFGATPRLKQHWNVKSGFLHLQSTDENNEIK